jgi:dolichol-phosphate mannosyltransferase
MKALVIIPTYNESENIEKIVPLVLDQDSSIHVLIVDDNSPDGTGRIADEMAKKDGRFFVIHREKKSGLGTAYIAGFKFALEKGYDLIFEMDCDFSHDPKYVYSRLVTGLPVKDATSGFKCFRREVLEAIDLDRVKSNGYSFQIEMSFRAWKKGFKIKEIPIIFEDRKVGQSKMSKKIVREAVWMVWKLRLRSLLGRL